MSEKIKCKTCGKIFSKYGIKSHIWRTHGDGINHKSGSIPWNKGLTKETDVRVKKQSDTSKEKYKNGEIIPSFFGKKHTNKTKEKISKSRIKYLKENPDKVPYLLNHSSKISYPEQTMIKYLNEYNVKGWIHQMQFSIYQLDFAFPEYKLCVEIDGSTHLLKNVIEIDKRRDKFLNIEGWRVLRITAKEIKENVYKCINLILNTLGEKQIEIPKEFLTKQYYKEEKIRLTNKQKELNKIKKEELYNKRKELILNSNIDFNSHGWLTKLSKYLNITDNGIKKFMKLYMTEFYNNCI